MQGNERKILLDVGERILNILKGKIPEKIDISEYSDEVVGDEKENLDFMIEGAKRIRQLVESLLTYAQVLEKDVVIKNVDLNVVVEDIKNLELSSCIQSMRGTLLIPELLPVARCDPDQIRILLQSLINNAFKYHKSDIPPAVTIRACRKKDGSVRVEIEDNGIGIQSDYYKNIFAIFKRLHNRHEYEGTGIGLALCKRIVEKHNGEIGVDSIYGQGSTFWFTLPAHKIPVDERSVENDISEQKLLSS